MKLRDLVKEAPIPDDWDSSAFTKEKSFASRVRYAKERAKRLGGGSSRVAFEIEYQGRPTVLKIAKNKKGMAQNDYESQMLADWYVKDLGITIPMIDDNSTDQDDPTWLHVEKATKMKPNEFKKLVGGFKDQYELQQFVEWSTGKRREPPGGMSTEDAQQKLEDDELLDGLMNLAGNYDIAIPDLCMRSNWGLYKGNPVLIDVGGSSEVMQKYYS